MLPFTELKLSKALVEFTWFWLAKTTCDGALKDFLDLNVRFKRDIHIETGYCDFIIRCSTCLREVISIHLHALPYPFHMARFTNPADHFLITPSIRDRFSRFIKHNVNLIKGQALKSVYYKVTCYYMGGALLELQNRLEENWLDIHSNIFILV